MIPDPTSLLSRDEDEEDGEHSVDEPVDVDEEDKHSDEHNVDEPVDDYGYGWVL